MEEKKEITAPSVNKAEDNSDTDTTEKTEPTIPIKFNKEVKNISVAEAQMLAQKGMKYDLIAEDYKRLQELSRESGKSVTEFLEALRLKNYDMRVNELTEKCGGDRELAEHIISLENTVQNKADNGFSELIQYFPEIKTKEDLPYEILQASELKGTMLLDEYLRYLLNKRVNDKQIREMGKFGERASIGSQISRMGAISPEATEFLKGLWK